MTAAVHSSSDSYHVAPGDIVHDRDAVVAVWRDCLGNAEGRDAKYDWYYRDAPGGACLELLKTGSPSLVVGTAGVGWRRMRLGDDEIPAGLLSDMAVLAEHRMLGPALSLQRKMTEHALSSAEMVYGFPNPNAVPVVKRLGFVHAGEMTLLARPLRHARYLPRMLPRSIAGPLGWLVDGAVRLRDRARSLADAHIDATWHDMPPDPLPFQRSVPTAVEGIRSHELLAWRFSRCPVMDARFLHIRQHGESSASAWFACHLDGHTLRVDDYGFGQAASFPGAVRALLDVAFRAGHHAVAIECCLPGDEMAAWRDNGFRERQSRPIYVRWRDPAKSNITLRITAFDEDE